LSVESEILSQKECLKRWNLFKIDSCTCMETNAPNVMIRAEFEYVNEYWTL